MEPIDIDDTVKITDVLSTVSTLEATFLDDPVPVSGMPAVYASLQQSLSNPSFFYVSGSPSQLYPFIHSFIDSTYPAGPIMLQNVTLTDFSELSSLTSPDGIEVYKLAMIDRINSIYPGKTFLTVGDSTQKDPETYGAACVRVIFSPNCALTHFDRY
jgi:phosphatidate phosphatase APP1